MVGGDGTSATDLRPFGGDLVGAVQDADRGCLCAPAPALCLDGIARGPLGEGTDLGGLVGTYLHVEDIALASLPDMVGGIDKELGCRVVLGTFDGVNGHAA